MSAPVTDLCYRSRVFGGLPTTALLLVALALACAPALRGQQSAVRHPAPEAPFSGEEWNYTFHSWQSQDGLPEETVQAFSQTPDGYLWVGTSGGLLRFDGARFRLFAHENTPAFVENSVFCLLTGRDGSLWIGTDGSGLIEMKEGKFQVYPTEDGRSTGFVRALQEDRNGLVWVATDDGLFWARNGRLERADKQLGMPAFNVHAVLEDRTGRMWVGGARLYAIQAGKPREFSLPGNASRNKVKSFLETADGSIWVGTVAGLYRLCPGQDNFEPVPGVVGTIRTLREVPSGELWAGAIGEGIFRIRGNTVTRLKAPAPLISNTVLSIFADNDKSLWIGTQAGMMRLSRTPVQVLALPGAADSDFGTVSLDADGSIWAASNQLVRVQAGVAVPDRVPGLGDARVRNLLRARDSSLWIGTDGSGAYHQSTNGSARYTTREGLVNNFVRSFLEARDGSLWIGTDDGLSHLTSAGFQNFTILNGLAYNSIRSLLQDRDGVIWIGTEHGVSGWMNGRFLHNALTTALQDEKIWALHQDASGGLWFGTRTHGLYRYRDGALTHYTTANGLASNSIYCILEDEHGHFWLSGPSGVSLLNREELDAQAANRGQMLSMRIFRATEGGKSTQFYGGTEPSGVLTRSGEAWFPTNQGLWRIRPTGMEHPLISHLNLDSILVDGRPVPFPADLSLSAGSSRLEIGYQPVLLRSQEELRFRYRLNGFDSDWTYAGALQRQATYTNLPAGTYTFEVQAWEADHPEEPARTSLTIVKRPFFYRTAWFLALCVALAALISYLIYGLRMRQIRGRFKAVLAERTRLAREMHDTLIQGCASVSALLEAAGSSGSMDNESRMHMIEYAGTQVRATMDEARQAVWNLRADERVAHDMPAAFRQMTARVSREHGVEVDLQLQGKPFSMSQPATHELMMVAREAVFNAIMHGHPQTIHAELVYTFDSLTMTIADNGKGFDSPSTDAANHFGIQGMRERIRSFGGSFEIESGRDRGTSVRVEVPRTSVTKEEHK